MEIDKLRGSLARLGIPASDYRLLKLLPLVYVAWSDGKMAAAQKQRIHAFAVEHFELSAAGAAVLQGWLAEAPTHAYIVEGLRDILFLAKAQDDMGVDFSELPLLLAHAERIARSSGELLELSRGVSSDEESAMQEVARELHIDHGTSWTKLLKSLE